jgi:hypothetical protein
MNMQISKHHRKAFAFISVLLALVVSSLSAKEARTVKIFLLGGQSNMFGVGGVATDLQPPYNVPLYGVEIWNLNTNHWKPLSPKGNKFGPELSFGHSMSKAFPECDIRLVKYAASGTALYNDWAPTSGAQYLAFMDTVRAAMEDLRSNQVDFEIAGMLWLQGESDAHEKKGADYQQNLTAFIAHLRMEFNTPEMPVVIARVRDFYGKGEQAKMVRNAQEQVAAVDQAVEWFDTDDCGPLVKGGHYASDGLIEIGKRFAGKFK